ncbi:MAG: hypothetical protein ABF876_18950 [Acetobacter aceti]
MARALSDDLRERVLEAGVAGASARSIAARPLENHDLEGSKNPLVLGFSV